MIAGDILTDCNSDAQHKINKNNYSVKIVEK